MADSTDSSVFDTLQNTADSVVNSISKTTTGFKVIGLPGGGTLLNVTIPQIQMYNNIIQEINGPRTPFGQLQQIIGTPTIPPLARGVVNSSSIAAANNNLFHNCGFLNNMNIFGDISGVISSISQLLTTLKNPRKYGAAATIRVAFGNLSQLLRDVINAILTALGFDFTGEVAKEFAYVKSVLRYIANEIRKITKIIRDVAAIAQIAVNLNSLLNYIKNLPNQIQAILKNCLLQFTGSVKGIANSLKSLSTASNTAGSTTAAYNTLVTNANATSTKVQSTTVPVKSTIVYNAVNNPGSVSNNDIQNHISGTYGTVESTAAASKNATITVTPSPYSKANTSSA